VYVFVLLNKPGKAVEYFIVPGKDLASDPNRSGLMTIQHSGIGRTTLQNLAYADAWQIFGTLNSN